MELLELIDGFLIRGLLVRVPESVGQMDDLPVLRRRAAGQMNEVRYFSLLVLLLVHKRELSLQEKRPLVNNRACCTFLAACLTAGRTQSVGRLHKIITRKRALCTVLQSIYHKLCTRVHDYEGMITSI